MTNKKLLNLVKSANEKLKNNPFDDRPPEPWTLKDITDQRDLNRANDWRLATRWPWVDAVAWVAVSDPEIMSVLSTCRSKFTRDASADLSESERIDTAERKCWAVLQTRVDRLSLEDADRQLRAWCRAGLAPVDGTGAAVVLPTARPPYEAMLSAADVQRMTSVVHHPGSLHAAETQALLGEARDAEYAKLADRFDAESIPKRRVSQDAIAERWDASNGPPPTREAIMSLMKGKKAGRTKAS